MAEAIKKIVSAVQAAASAVPAASEPPAERRDDGPEPPATPELNPRNRMMQEIAERSNATRDAEAKETIPPGEEDAQRAAAEEEAPVTQVAGDTEPQRLPDATAAPPQTPATSADSSSSPSAPAGAATQFDANAEYDLVVEGKTIKVKGAQIIDSGRRTLQKETAADYKLETASKILQAAEERARQVLSTTDAPATQPAVTAKTDADLAQFIQFGTQEQAAQAIAEIRRRDSTAVTPEGMQQFIAKQLPAVVNEQLAFQDAVKYVQSEHADLLADDYLKTLFFTEENRRRQQGDRRPYRELYQSIGEDLRKHFNRPKAGAPAAPAPTLEQRREAKAAAPAAPRLASVRLAGGADTAKPKSREEIIAGMAASRGMNALSK